MRMALAQAHNHVRGRAAFQRRLIDQPLMRSVLADLSLEYEAAVALSAKVPRRFDDTDETGRAFARLSVAIGKFWLTKRCPNFVFEAMECHGGVGYVEETPMPRLFRESPLNAIWEGSGNVIALDILRTLHREPAALEAYRQEIETARGADRTLDQAASRLFDEIAASGANEARGRVIAERMALVLQAALLVQHAPPAVADAFCATRLGEDRGVMFGAIGGEADLDAILARL